MKIFVTGATGFVGGHLTRALVQAGHEVVGLTRKPPTGEDPVPGISYVTGDVTDAATPILDKLAGCAALIHLVGIIQEVPGRGQTFEAVHVQGTKNALAAARAAGVSERFVYLSAVGAEPDAPAEYSRTKAQAEQAIRESGLPSTIFRPSIILGPGCEFLPQIEALIRKPPLAPFALPFVPVPGAGTNRFQPVWIGDLVACIVRCLDDPATANQTYEIGGATETTFNDLIAAVEQHIGVRKPLLHVPMPLMFAAASVLEALLPRSPITTDQLLSLRRDNVCDNGPVRAAFGIEPLPFAQALERCYRRSAEAGRYSGLQQDSR